MLSRLRTPGWRKSDTAVPRLGPAGSAPHGEDRRVDLAGRRVADAPSGVRVAQEAEDTLAFTAQLVEIDTGQRAVAQHHPPRDHAEPRVARGAREHQRAQRIPIQRRSLVDTVVDRLQSEIASGAWPVGTRIPTEAELVATLGVSRPSVREGVRALAQLGLLETRQGDGTYVIASDPTEVTLRRTLHDADPGEVFVVRRALDALAAVQAAENGDAAILALMEAALIGRQDAADRGDGEAFIDHDVAFHLYVVKASGNALLGGIYTSFVTSLRNSVAQRLKGSMALAESPDDQHEALFQAIRAGDGQAAQDAALGIIERSVKFPES